MEGEFEASRSGTTNPNDPEIFVRISWGGENRGVKKDEEEADRGCCGVQKESDGERRTCFGFVR